MSSWYLQQLDPAASAVGALIVAAGLGIVYYAWRRSGRHRGLLVLGWSAIALSLWPWTLAAGFDVGPALGTVVLMLAATLLVALTGQWRSAAPRTRAAPAAAAPSPAPIRLHAWRMALLRLICAGPIAFGAAACASMLLLGHAPWPAPSRLAAAGYLTPVLWAAGMVWGVSDPRPVRPLAIMAVIALVALVLLPVGR